MKKLTAGIFTVMMGLVAANSADAAVASKGYVDEVAKANTTLITNLTQTVETNATTAANATAAVAKDLADYEASNDAAVKAAKDAADKGVADAAAVSTALGEYKTSNDAALALKANADDVYTKGQVDQKVADVVAGDMTEALEAYVTTETYTAGLALKGDKTAVEKNAEDIAKNAQAIADEELARENADSALDGKITANTSAITTLNGNATTAGSVAKSIADAFTAANLDQYAKTSAMETALTSYELKSNLKALAYKDTVGTDDIDNGAVTTAKLADGAVDASKLGEGAVTNAAVADGALSQDKIDGLNTTLETKMTITSETTETGKYVFTANVGEDGVTDYAWELIERGGPTAD